jgi:dephospho-CoA kinase
MRLGLTGGIGSGKSTVASYLAELGATLIDADTISRQSTAIGGSAIESIRAIFGDAYITPLGALDREKIRALVFDDPASKIRLEAIIHPIVAQRTAQLATEAAQRQCPLIVFDIPLLAESEYWRAQLDQILVVDCAVETQIQRVMTRSAWSREMVEKVIAAQATREVRLACADSVIFNDGIGLAHLRVLVAEWVHRFGL